MAERVQDPIKETSEEKLSAAIDRVYGKYGTDLPAFFRDVYNELTLKRQDTRHDPNGRSKT